MTRLEIRVTFEFAERVRHQPAFSVLMQILVEALGLHFAPYLMRSLLGVEITVIRLEPKGWVPVLLVAANDHYEQARV